MDGTCQLPPSVGFLLLFQGSLAKPSVPEAPQVHNDGQSTTAGLLSWQQSKVPEQKQEKAGKKDNNHTKEVWRKGGQRAGGTPKHPHAIDHASMGDVPPIPLGTRPPSLLNPELQFGGGKGRLAGGQPQQPPSLTPQSWGLWAASALGRACIFKTPLLLWGVSTKLPTKPLNTPKKTPLMVPAARGNVSRRGWEQSPAAAPLGRGDGKRRVGVTALHLCLQRKHRLGQRVPGGLGVVGARGDDRQRPCCKGLRWLLQSSEPKALRLRAAEGMGSPGPPLSCLEGLVGPGPAAELVSLGRQGTTPGWWAAWLTTCKPPAPPASPA